MFMRQLAVHQNPLAAASLSQGLYGQMPSSTMAGFPSSISGSGSGHPFSATLPLPSLTPIPSRSVGDSPFGLAGLPGLPGLPGSSGLPGLPGIGASPFGQPQTPQVLQGQQQQLLNALGLGAVPSNNSSSSPSPLVNKESPSNKGKARALARMLIDKAIKMQDLPTFCTQYNVKVNAVLQSYNAQTTQTQEPLTEIDCMCSTELAMFCTLSLLVLELVSLSYPKSIIRKCLHRKHNRSSDRFWIKCIPALMEVYDLSSLLFNKVEHVS